MGVMLVPKPSKYKSIGVNTDTYEKIVKMARDARRNISTQLSMIVDDEYDKYVFRNPEPARRKKNVSKKRTVHRLGGLSAVIED